jgi:hypothetical protein
MSNHSSSSSTPDGDPTHSTYEVNVPVRNGRTSEPKVENPEIRIPRIKPVSDTTSSGTNTDQQQQQQIPQSQNQEMDLQKLAAGLDGKYVDEFGNILDWDGTVLGRVQGDLPSMVGRPVTADGQVLDEDGEVAGQVCDNYIEPEPPKLKPLASGGLKVDDEGFIYDDQGNRVKVNRARVMVMVEVPAPQTLTMVLPSHRGLTSCSWMSSRHMMVFSSLSRSPLSLTVE